MIKEFDEIDTKAYTYLVKFIYLIANTKGWGQSFFLFTYSISFHFI